MKGLATIAVAAAVVLIATFMVGVSSAESVPRAPPTNVNSTATIYREGYDDYKIVFGVLDTSGVAWGFYNSSGNTTGWGIFQVETSSNYSDNEQAYAAGYLEAALTQPEVYSSFLNMMYFYWPGETQVPDDVAGFFYDQDRWMRDQIKENKDDWYWQAVSLIVSQYDGFIKGYQDVAPSNQYLDIIAFQVLNGVGDLLDIIPALNVSKRVNWFELDPKEVKMKIARNGHCSAMVKVTGDYSDLFMGHSSWFTFGAMVRIFKHYLFNFNSEFVAAKYIAFSSYPGFLESLDDFYMLSSNLVMLQTTNSIFNYDLYKDVSPESLLAWHRVRLSNMVAKTGYEWADTLSRHNSGTYNNQYMVVDLNLFEPYQPLPANTLWVIEQIPGYVESADETLALTRGYWPSYNVAYFPTIFNLSGYPEMVQKYGNDNSYQMAPRAQIFRREQGKVETYEDYKNFLRYNDYFYDPYGKGDPDYAICSRYDLIDTGAQPFGCIDSKATSYTRAKQLYAEAINGPTLGYNNIFKPFQWSEFPGYPHYGQPEIFDYSFIPVYPQINQTAINA